MKLITANKLNLFWKNGVLPIKNALLGKIDNDKVLKTKEEVTANTDLDNVVGAAVVSEIIDDLNAMPQYVYDEAGKIIGYKTSGGADTVFPFSSYSGDITQNIVPGSNPIRYTIIAPTADITWRLFGGDCYVKLDNVIKGSTPSISQSTANGDFSAVRGQVITGVCQYPSGSYINITEHFDQTDIQRQDT